MRKNIAVEQVSNSEKGRIVAVGAALGGLVFAFGAVAANKLQQPDPLENTHKQEIHVVFGDQANNEIDMAHFLQEHRHTPDSTQVLVERMNHIDPNHDHGVDPGQEMDIPVDIQNTSIQPPSGG